MSLKKEKSSLVTSCLQTFFSSSAAFPSSSFLFGVPCSPISLPGPFLFFKTSEFIHLRPFPVISSQLCSLLSYFYCSQMCPIKAALIGWVYVSLSLSHTDRQTHTHTHKHTQPGIEQALHKGYWTNLIPLPSSLYCPFSYLPISCCLTSVLCPIVKLFL